MTVRDLGEGAEAAGTVARMARLDQVHEDNAEGDWFVDTRCIDCDVARHWAPDLVGADEHGLSFIARQPQTDDERAALWRAAEACPTQSIGNRLERRPPAPAFPFALTDDVLALGHNHVGSFGAHSYLLRRPDGNVLVDSPRFLKSLAERVDDEGGIADVVLTHRDDVADAERWADRYGANVWIHEADEAAAPFATDHIVGTYPVELRPGMSIVPTPGHTRGCVCLHVDDRLLFTGDTLHWDHRAERLDVFAGVTWYSWDVLADSIEAMAALRADWVFPGHGMWHEVGAEAYRQQLTAMAPAMRTVGRSDWSNRDG